MKERKGRKGERKGIERQKMSPAWFNQLFNRHIVPERYERYAGTSRGAQPGGELNPFGSL